jgi:hypothetical protein
MPADPAAASRPPVRPAATPAGLRRLVWALVFGLFWGAFELGRWAEAADPWHFPRVFSGPVGAVMVVAAAVALRGALRRLAGRPGSDAPAS